MPGDHMTQSRSPAFSGIPTPCGFLMTPTFLLHVLPLPMGGKQVRFACVFQRFGGLTEQRGYVPGSFEVTALVETTYRTRLYGSVALPTVYPAITALCNGRSHRPGPPRDRSGARVAGGTRTNGALAGRWA
jgi:hypothetical protein